MATPAYRQASRDLRWTPDAWTYAWAAAGGIVAAIVIGIPMHALGMMVTGPAALAGSDNVWVGWAVHVAAGVVFGTPFAALLRPMGYARAAIRGALYGLLVGVAFAWIGMFTLLGRPLMTMEGAIIVGLHVPWGIVVGLATAWGARRG